MTFPETQQAFQTLQQALDQIAKTYRSEASELQKQHTHVLQQEKKEVLEAFTHLQEEVSQKYQKMGEYKRIMELALINNWKERIEKFLFDYAKYIKDHPGVYSYNIALLEDIKNAAMLMGKEALKAHLHSVCSRIENANEVMQAVHMTRFLARLKDRKAETTLLYEVFDELSQLPREALVQEIQQSIEEMMQLVTATGERQPITELNQDQNPEEMINDWIEHFEYKDQLQEPLQALRKKLLALKKIDGDHLFKVILL